MWFIAVAVVEMNAGADPYRYSRYQDNSAKNATFGNEQNGTNETQEENHEERQNRRRELRNQETQIRFGRFLILIGIGQGFIYAVQAAFLYLTLQEQTTSNKRAQRAYVCFEIEHNSLNVAAPATFKYRAQNVGQTPAYDVKVEMEWKGFDGNDVEWPKGEPFDYRGEETGTRRAIFPTERPHYSTYFPNHHLGMNFHHRLNQFFANQATIFVYGEISYRDAFDETHITEFCCKIATKPDGVKLVGYELHNDAH